MTPADQQHSDYRPRIRGPIDLLTGFASRYRFVERIDELTQGQDEGVVVIFDLDRMKSLNDRLGHATGDAVLVEVARRIAQVVDQAGLEALVARIGGDEFGLVLAGVDTKRTQRLVGQIQAAVSAPIPTHRESTRITASAGVAAIGADADVSRYVADLRRAKASVRHRQPPGQGSEEAPFKPD